MAAGDDAQRSSWTPRDYILAALGGCLAATAIVIIVSVVLSPGRIVFSITQATHDHEVESGMNLKLTILANNTSHRAKVQYLSFFVVLTNTTSATGKFTTDAVVNQTFPFPAVGRYMPGPGFMEVPASVHLLAGEMAGSFIGQRLDSGGLTVLLTTEVRFQIGLARTKIFDIRVSCPDVAFVQEQPNSRRGQQKSRAQPKSQAQPVFRCDG